MKKSVILLVEDNIADQLLMKRALVDANIPNKLMIANNGIEALEYLRREGKYANPDDSPTPNMIILDINMPMMDGKQVLREIKSDPRLKMIPAIMFTTSSQEQDIIESYQLGANAYINKPIDIAQFMDMIEKINQFWFVVAELPN